MPATKGQWIVFAAGLLAFAVLCVATVAERNKSNATPAKTSNKPAATALPATETTATPTVATNTRQSTLPTATSATTPGPATTTTATTTSNGGTTLAPATTTTTTTTTTSAVASPAKLVRFRVLAQADTWISIRSGSATGQVAFEGTLPQGESRTFAARRFWVRSGAAANVQASIDGRPLQLPAGTFSVSISPNGLGKRTP